MDAFRWLEALFIVVAFVLLLNWATKRKAAR
jgi:hypothetical protein